MGVQVKGQSDGVMPPQGKMSQSTEEQKQVGFSGGKLILSCRWQTITFHKWTFVKTGRLSEVNISRVMKCVLKVPLRSISNNNK